MQLDRAGFALSLSLTLGVLVAPLRAHAQWGPDGIPVTALNTDQHTPVSAPDGAGGMFVAWFDDRGSFGRQIFAQRLDASGVPAWTVNGIPVRNANSTNWSLSMVADGQGGAILAWYTGAGAYDQIFAQRLDAGGSAHWGVNGKVVCASLSEQLDPRLTPDGAGGAIFAWNDKRNGSDGDLYAQRLDADGIVQWDSVGVPLCVAAHEQLNPGMVACGSGGAFVAWEDHRDGVRYKVYAQLVDASGAPQWAPDGVPVCPAPRDQYEPALVDDQANGALIAWSDFRLSHGAAVYAQHFSHAGAALWDSAGVALGDSVGNVVYPRALADGAGGAFVAWQALVGNQYYIVGQRVSASGADLFGPSGVRLTNAPGSETHPCIASDGGSGAVVAWTDSRGSSSDIYAQRLGATGERRWEAEGRAVCTAALIQNTPTIAPGPPGSAIVAWNDRRSNTNYDVYAGRPDSTSVLDVPWEMLATGRVGSLRPNPTRAGAALDFALTTSQRLSIVVFDVGGRVVRHITNGRSFTAGAQTVVWDGTSDRGDTVPVGVYNVRVWGSEFTLTRRVAIVR